MIEGILCYLNSIDYRQIEAEQQQQQLAHLLYTIHSVSSRRIHTIWNIIENNLSWLEIKKIDNKTLASLILNGEELLYVLDNLMPEHRLKLTGTNGEEKSLRKCCTILSQLMTRTLLLRLLSVVNFSAWIMWHF